MTSQEQADLLTLRQTHSEVNQMYEFVQQFAQMLRTRSGEQLDTWLAKGADCQLPELQSFVLSVERDKPAVASGLTLPHRNGIGDRKGQHMKASHTYEVWQGRIPAPLVNGCSMRSSHLCSPHTERLCV
ncbi:MAG TPA: hypothetical protein VKB35_05590 [Ktedonobacteraceae bacterium]|nr:hypothetical protein [Ktedonobacteraceae bacterium]